MDDTSAKIVPLHEGSAIPSGRAVNPRLVETLEKVLAMAQAGELQGAALVLHYHDNCAATWLAGTVGGFTMLGAMTAAQHSLAVIVNSGER